MRPAHEDLNCALVRLFLIKVNVGPHILDFANLGLVLPLHENMFANIGNAIGVLGFRRF